MTPSIPGLLDDYGFRAETMIIGEQIHYQLVILVYLRVSLRSHVPAAVR
jgi:hypothetical protein